MKNKYMLYSIFILIYRILLDWVYEGIICKSLSYNDVVICEYNNINTTISYLFLIVISFLFLILYKKGHNFVSAVVTFLFLVSVVPTSTLIKYSNYNLKFCGLITLYWVLFFVYALIIPNIKALHSKKNSRTSLYIVAICMSLIILYISGIYTGFRFHFTLLDVYDLRDESSGFAVPTIISYVHAASNYVLPFLYAYFLLNKKYIIAFSIATVILLNFGIAGHKSVLFALILATFGVYFFTYKRVNYLFYFFSALPIVAFIEFKLFGTSFFASLFVYRVLFLPSILNYCYYDFFSVREFDYYRQGILGKLGLDSPYDTKIPYIIGETYFNDSDTFANNGLFSDAYLNFGTIGVVLFPMILIMFFKLIDSLSRSLDQHLMFVPVFIISIVLLSAAFTTSLLTNGLLILAMMIFFIPKSNLINKI